jgi:N-acetylglucosaminyl-diphospho-decaprenol L-rhamnosyltransferase
VIDAVVVTMDSREMVLQCLQYLDTVDRAIVVDNASQDATADAVAAAHPDVTVIRLGEARSLAGAYNEGAAGGSGELVLFLNDDILVEPGSIDRLVQALADDDGAVAASGRLVDSESGETQHQYEPRPFPGIGRFVVAFTGLERVWAGNPWSAPHKDRPLDGAAVAVDQPAGACLLVEREAFEAVGGWDEGFELWFEDTDLARRLSKRGRILYVPAASFRHVGGHSTRRLSRAEIVRRSYGSALRYGGKHFGRGRRLALGLLFGSTAAVRSVTSRRDPELAEAYREIRKRATRLRKTS